MFHFILSNYRAEPWDEEWELSRPRSNLQHSLNLGNLTSVSLSVKQDNSKDSLLGLLRKLVEIIFKTIMFKAELLQVLISYLCYCSLIWYLFRSDYSTELWVASVTLGLPDVCILLCLNNWRIYLTSLFEDDVVTAYVVLWASKESFNGSISSLRRYMVLETCQISSMQPLWGEEKSDDFLWRHSFLQSQI